MRIVALVLAVLLTATSLAAAQPGIVTREHLIEYTPDWKGERFPDGRPKVPDAILDRMRSVTLEEAWAVVTAAGFSHQFEDQWLSIHPDKVLVGRVLTSQWLPGRPDILRVIEAKGREQYFKGMIAFPLARAPGSAAEYTDWNMVLMQFIVERLTGQTLDQFVEARVFGPLGMRDTRYNPPESMKPRIAPTETEDFRGGQVWGVVHDETAWVLGGVSGNAGLFSSARDLAVFVQMLLNGGSYGGVQILKPSILDGHGPGAFSIVPIWKELIAKGRLFGAVMDGYSMHVTDPAALSFVETRLR
jgi:hypothetical protein